MGGTSTVLWLWSSSPGVTALRVRAGQRTRPPPLASITLGEDTPARFDVNLAAAIHPAHLQEAHRV